MNNYSSMKATTQQKNLYKSTSPQKLKIIADAHLKENLFVKDHSDLDVTTFNYAEF
jgi:hypothetical protein